MFIMVLHVVHIKLILYVDVLIYLSQTTIQKMQHGCYYKQVKDLNNSTLLRASSVSYRAYRSC